MRYICRFILFLCIFFITLSANAFCEISGNIISKHTDTISAVHINDYDMLYSKNNAAVVQNGQRNENLQINGKESDNSLDGGLNNFLHQQTSQFEDLLSYIYSKSYLRNKTKVNLLKVLSEIQPNAP